MSKFKELLETSPEVAKRIVTMSKDEMIERLAELEMYKENNDFFEKELEHIVNLGLDWLRSNKKNNHYIHIEKDCVKLVQKEIIETDEETGMVIVLNPETKVSIRTEISQENGIVYHMMYKIKDQTSLILNKRANIIIRPDGDNYWEASGFKDLEDVLKSLNK